LEPGDLAWQPDPAIKAAGVVADWDTAKKDSWKVIRAEIEELQMLMQDDRDRYLAEIDLQADYGPDYIVAFIGASLARHPWTIELIDCGLAIGNIAYSYYKQLFKRVRPSVLCPGLVPPFGPPAHPSFPSGHSFLGHLMTLLLLEIPALKQRYGVFDPTQPEGSPGNPVDPNPSHRKVTISAATPAVVSWKSHGLSANDPIFFETTGTLPAPITAGQTYYVRPSGLTADSFQISTAVGGSAVNTNGSLQSGTHTIPRPTVTISAANPAVVGWKSHGLKADNPVIFQTPGALPTPIKEGQVYYVLSPGLTADSFRISTKVGGSPINTGASTNHTEVHTIPRNPLRGSGAFDSPLLWLGQRLAKNRERLGVHYASDSNASRHVAAAVWRALLHETDYKKRIVCPTLESVIGRAKAEWPTKW
jgi:hypothetical protein